MANNFAEAMQQGYGFGAQQRQEREKRSKLAELQGLSSQVIGGDLGATDRAFALDPAAAKAYQGEGDRRKEQLAELAKGWKQIPREQKQAYYERFVAPAVSSMGFGDLGQYNETEVDGIADQILAAYGQTGNSNLPSGLREFQGMTQGLPQEDVMRARRIALGLDGRASSAGFSQVKFTDAQGRERVGVMNGKTGQIDLPDGTSFNPQTGAMSQTRADSFVPGEDGTQIPMQTVTGADGQVYRVQLGDPNAAQAGAADMGTGGQASSVQFPSRDVSPSQRGGDPFTGRRKEDEAAAIEAAKQRAQLEYLPQELGLRSAAAIEQARGVEEAKTGIERESAARTKAPQLLNVERGLTRIASAMQKLDGGMVNTGPLDQAVMRFTPEGQELEAAVGSIKNDMLALTRVPGVGSQSDLEQRIADLKYPAIGNHPEVNRRNLMQLNAFLRDLEEAVGRSRPKAGGAEAARPATQADFDALPSGATYIDPDDGRTYRKP